ncbi:MAG: 16S rRNA (cytidine(1402)-2'-O)-methyltransferase [Gammaproteobacteria bacterium]|nr:MAG: 16S rRNA (cytidine(1402)-2'-O)-methyltransferase [Gammaproteobacteria bacterium]
MPEGVLSIVATPIGNLEDITARAVRTLKEADRILAEDTRHTRKLLAHLGVEAAVLISLHEHNERARIEQVLGWLAAGEQLVLVSDAGTPLISDPGYPLVRAVREAGYSVTPVPGPCALIAALSASGLPTDRFAFEGFLPAKSGARRQHLSRLRQEERTLVFYESTHRIHAMVEDLVSVMGADREAVIARELTKTWETVLAGSLGEFDQILKADLNQGRGELVVMVRGATQEAGQADLNADQVLAVLDEVLPPKTAAVVAARILGGHKRDWYGRLMAKRDQQT